MAADHDAGQDHRILDPRPAVNADAGEEQRTFHIGTGNDAAAGYQRVDRHPAAAVVVEDELGRRQLFLVGPDRPVLVVEIELGCDLGHFHVRLPVGVDGSDVPPVRFVMIAADAGLGEAVGEDPVARHDVGNDVLAEVAAGALGQGVAFELFEKEFGVEDIDTHRRQCAVRVAGNGRRVLGLFDEVDDAIVLVHSHHPELPGFVERHVEAGDGHVGLVLDVEGQHAPVVHLVDVVAGDHQHVLRVVVAEEAHVLEDRVGGALVPLGFVDLLLRGQELDELAEAPVEKVPAALDMVDQAVRLVLGGDANFADA